MEDSNELRFECTQCGNCCSDKSTLVNVTYRDILRIKSGLHLNLDEIIEVLGFYVFEKTPTSEELRQMVVPPIQTENGLAFVGLKKETDGTCLFYSKEKKACNIYAIRPNFCRTFPFSYRIIRNNEDTNLELYYTDKGVEYCPGIGSDSPSIKLDYWIAIGKLTIKDLDDNNVLIKKWNDAVNNGDIHESAKNFLQTVLNLS